MVWLASAAKLLAPVWNVVVWQLAQPMLTNWLDPWMTVLLLGPGVGGARNRMKLAKLVMSSNTASSTNPPTLKLLFTGGRGEQFAVSSRSVLKRRLVIPISTL